MSPSLSPSGEEIPVTPINLAVPLKVSSGRKLSDKYLELEKNKSPPHSKKNRSKKDDSKKKKKKKGKPDVEGNLVHSVLRRRIKARV